MVGSLNSKLLSLGGPLGDGRDGTDDAPDGGDVAAAELGADVVDDADGYRRAEEAGGVHSYRRGIRYKESNSARSRGDVLEFNDGYVDGPRYSADYF